MFPDASGRDAAGASAVGRQREPLDAWLLGPRKRCGRACVRLPFCLSWITVLWLSAPPAAAQHEIRLLLASGAARVTLTGRELRVLDDEGEQTLAPAGQRLVVCREGEGVAAKGVFDPQPAIRIAGEDVVVDGHRPLGVLEIRGGRGGLWLVDRLPLEEYVARVVEAEMGGGWPLEALKAQAVAARSFALRRCLQRQEEAYDLVASTSDQAFARGSIAEGRVRQAVQETFGEVLAFEGFPAEATYSACCGGRTGSAEEVFGEKVPYLRSNPDPYCAGCPGGEWQRNVARAELEKALVRAGRIRGKVARCETDAGTLVCRAGDARLELRPAELRRLLGPALVPAARFSIKVEKTGLVLAGRGRGHGVGMCQWGARGMAEQGSDYREILRRYYPGAELRKMY